MKKTILLQILLLVLGLLPSAVLSKTYEITEISLLSINSAITPATYDYLEQNFKRLPPSSLAVIEINTPGGLISTTKDIITLFGREKKPVAVWITPEGASAASAGAIIASAAHFIFMSPGTNMGAATPVGLGEDIKESDGRKKAINDLTALVRSLSHSRGRPGTPFEKMISGAESYTDKEAQSLGIINTVISSPDDIINYIAGKKITIDGIEQTLTIGPKLHVKKYEASLGQNILDVLANPSTAYFLFLIGIALIYIELQAPGGYIAGSFGVTCLILAGIAFQVLPLDWGSMGLVILGIALLILEIFMTSYGLLSVAGIASFVLGSLFLFHGEGGLITIQYPVIVSTFLGVFSALAIIVWYLWNDRKKQTHKANFFLPIGSSGTVLTHLSHHLYQVKVRGEIWKAQADVDLKIGDEVLVEEVDTNQLLLKIKKKSL